MELDTCKTICRRISAGCNWETALEDQRTTLMSYTFSSAITQASTLATTARREVLSHTGLESDVQTPVRSGLSERGLSMAVDKSTPDKQAQERISLGHNLMGETADAISPSGRSVIGSPGVASATADSDRSASYADQRAWR